MNYQYYWVKSFQCLKLSCNYSLKGRGWWNSLVVNKELCVLKTGTSRLNVILCVLSSRDFSSLQFSCWVKLYKSVRQWLNVLQ
jgi:hypothetical protein